MGHSDPSFDVLCENCGQRRGNHNTNAQATRCPAKWPNDYPYEWSETSTFKAVVNELDHLCQNCGNRSGTHRNKDQACPTFGTGHKWADGFYNQSVFLGTAPPQYKPIGWYPPKDLKDLVDEALDQETTNQLLITPVKEKPAKKEKKTKPWEEQKFNTPKVPKGEIKYYKAIPNKDHKPVTGDQVVTLDLGKVEETTVYKEVGGKYYAKYVDMMKAVEGLKGANAKPYNPDKQFYYHKYHQLYGRGLRDTIREEPPIEALAEAFLKKHASTKTMVQMLTDFAASAENPAVRKLSEKLSDMERHSRKLDALNASQSTMICEANDRAFKANDRVRELEAQMAEMVPKARPMVPRSFSENGRKFKDIA